MPIQNGDIVERVSRLEQRSRDMGEQVRRLEDHRDVLTRVEVQGENTREDMVELKHAFDDFKRKYDQDREKAAKQREADDDERKSDRRWVLTAIVGSAALVVTAVGIIVSAIT